MLTKFKISATPLLDLLDKIELHHELTQPMRTYILKNVEYEKLKGIYRVWMQFVPIFKYNPRIDVYSFVRSKSKSDAKDISFTESMKSAEAKFNRDVIPFKSRADHLLSEKDMSKTDYLLLFIFFKCLYENDLNAHKLYNNEMNLWIDEITL